MEKPEPQTRPIEQPTELLLEQPKEQPGSTTPDKKGKAWTYPKQETQRTLGMCQKTMLSRVLKHPHTQAKC